MHDNDDGNNEQTADLLNTAGVVDIRVGSFPSSSGRPATPGPEPKAVDVEVSCKVSAATYPAPVPSLLCAPRLLLSLFFFVVLFCFLFFVAPSPSLSFLFFLLKTRFFFVSGHMGGGRVQVFAERKIPFLFVRNSFPPREMFSTCKYWRSFVCLCYRFLLLLGLLSLFFL